MSEPASPKPFGPYSPLRRAGDFYYVAGQVGVDPVTGKASPTVAQQTKQVLENLRRVLADNCLDLGDIVKTTVFITDVNSFAVVNEVYVGYFGDSRPARSTVGVKELPRLGGDVPLYVEIEAVAYKESSA